jgi:hypothetical protein
MSADFIVDLIIAVFVVFMVSLSSVAWWSSQTPRKSANRAEALVRQATSDDQGQVSAY